jgi:hypothetical protein
LIATQSTLAHGNNTKTSADSINIVCDYVPATSGASGTPASFIETVFDSSASPAVVPSTPGEACSLAMKDAQTAGYMLVTGPLQLGNGAVLYTFSNQRRY